jgi:pimeloyl-ACP methyl ester carboxylesterase
MKLAYREFGQGPALIILHGLFGQSDNWNTLAKNFAEQGLHVYTLDQRNHGLSPHAIEWDYKEMANDLHEFILDHQIKNPILLGHSMGGKTVLFFQLMFPNIASKVILVDIAPRNYEPHHQQVLAALNAVDFNSIEKRKEAELILNQHIDDFGTKQFLLKNIYWKDSENTKMDWRFNLKVINDNYDKIGVEVPFFGDATKTLVIIGDKSNYVNVFDLEDYKKRFSNLRTVTITNAAHWVHAEKPKEFFNAVINFIKDEDL